jgi:steroid 5-alpha reductase family enzyme
MWEILLTHLTLFGSIILLYGIIIFVIASRIKDNSIMDIAYGPAFLVGAMGSTFITEHFTPLSLLITAVIFIWSMRLSIRIWHKNHGRPEDPRYATWRNIWSQKSIWYFYLRSYLQIYLLQGIIIVLVALPFILSLSNTNQPLDFFTYIGIAISLFGLLYETIADKQLDNFLARKRAGTESAIIMTTGLFRYSRRPNYFGETLVWWGLAIAVLPLPYGWIAIISPLLITYIVTRVTGPMLENIFLEKYPTEYREYINTTSYFIPWWPQRQSK